jgi:hypothetical protein
MTEAEDCSPPWLILPDVASVHVTSENPSWPIESAFGLNESGGWRASMPGKQTIALRFDAPQHLHELYLRFETPEPLTQEFLVGWSSDGGRTFHDLVRQQFTFSTAAPYEVERYNCDLPGVTHLQLVITPNISRSDAIASLTWLRLR